MFGSTLAQPKKPVAARADWWFVLTLTTTVKLVMKQGHI
jgi:hypothetical protein